MQTIRSSGLVAIQFLKHEKRMVNLKTLKLQDFLPHDKQAGMAREMVDI